MPLLSFVQAVSNVKSGVCGDIYITATPDICTVYRAQGETALITGWRR